MLKGVQSRTWTSFIEAVTATGRSLKPGIIFKGKELQKQWFLNELELIADWHYITSPNGWTDNHIALEWLKDVYLPQTELVMRRMRDSLSLTVTGAMRR